PGYYMLFILNSSGVPSVAKIVQIGPPMPKLVTLTDNFDANNLDTTKWTKYEGANYAVADTNQRLQITNTTSASDWGGIQSVNAYDATGSELSVNLINAGNAASQGAPFQWTKLTKNGDNANAVEIGVNNGTLFAKKFVAGTGTIISFIGYSPSAMQWVRLRESAGTTYWEYSANGSSWTVLASQADPIAMSTVKVEIGAGAWPGTAGTVAIDNVNNLPTLTAPSNLMAATASSSEVDL